MSRNLEYLQSLPEDLSGDESEDDVVDDVEDSDSYVQSSSSSDSSSDDDVPLAHYSRGRRTTVHESQLRSAGGISWELVTRNTSTTGRRAAHNILREQAGPTYYAKTRVGQELVTAWRVLIDETILRHIQNCTVAEANRQLGISIWTISIKELEQFISILYVRGVCGSRNIAVNDLWSKQWGIPFFSKTMSRNRFKEIMKYIRFDLRSE